MAKYSGSGSLSMGGEDYVMHVDLDITGEGVTGRISSVLPRNGTCKDAVPDHEVNGKILDHEQVTLMQLECSGALEGCNLFYTFQKSRGDAGLDFYYGFWSERKYEPDELEITQDVRSSEQIIRIPPQELLRRASLSIYQMA